MKKIARFLFIATLFSLCACNNSGGDKTSDNKATADSLEDEVMDGHNVGMAKMIKIDKAQAEVNRLIDSISKLPAKARDAAQPLKARLDSLLKDLDYAEFAMNKWMEEYNFDSAKDNIEERIKYLTEEKLKVDKVKDAILGSLQKADSLVKAKF